MSDAQRFQFRVMGGPAEVQLLAENVLAEKCARDIELEARRIEKKFSRYDRDSIVSRINECAGGETLQVDAETASLLDYAKVCYEQSEGLFDITSGVLRRAWDFKAGRIPQQSEVGALLPLIGWPQVEWKSPALRLPKPGMQIDFGGLGKEYAVDRCAAVCERHGVKAGLVNLAGDVRVFGPPPGEQPWKIGLAHPRKEGAVFASIELAGGAVATSGDYERYFEAGGKRYSHIMNPKTGWPVDSFQSVSVVAESCLIAGTASSIAMLLGEKKGIEFLDELGLPYVVCDAGGAIERSGGS